MLKSIQQKILGKKRFQIFFEKLHHFSKFGRNIGLPIDIESSGELNFIQIVRNHFKQKEKFIFFDIGANHGIYTDNILKFIPGEKCCYLFEPQEKLFTGLQQKFKGNDDVLIVNKGCGSKKERISLFSFAGIDTLASVYDNFKGTIQADSSEIIDVIKLDDFCIENSIPFIHFIKIDVEGHELEVIKGLRQYISERKVLIIQFEFGSFNIASRTFFKDFWEILHPHYNLYRILKNGQHEIKEYSHDLEIFDTTNYAAVLIDE